MKKIIIAIFLVVSIFVFACQAHAESEINSSKAAEQVIEQIHIQRMEIDTDNIRNGMQYLVVPVPNAGYEIEAIFLYDGSNFIPACAYCAGDETLTCVFYDLDIVNSCRTVRIYLIWRFTTVNTDCLK